MSSASQLLYGSIQGRSGLGSEVIMPNYYQLTGMTSSSTGAARFSATQCLRWNPTGSKAFVVYDGVFLDEFALTSNYDVSTASFEGSTNPNRSPSQSIASIEFFNNGNSFIGFGDLSGVTGAVLEYSTSAPYDISSPVFVGETTITEAAGTRLFGGSFSLDGLSLFGMRLGVDNLVILIKLTLTTPYDVSSYTAYEEFPLPAGTFTESESTISVINDTIIYIPGAATNIYRFDMGTAGDISTASFVEEFDYSVVALGTGAQRAVRSVYPSSDGYYITVLQQGGQLQNFQVSAG